MKPWCRWTWRARTCNESRKPGTCNCRSSIQKECHEKVCGLLWALLVFSQGLEEGLGLWWSIGPVVRGRSLDLGSKDKLEPASISVFVCPCLLSWGSSESKSSFASSFQILPPFFFLVNLAEYNQQRERDIGKSSFNWHSLNHCAESLEECSH